MFDIGCFSHILDHVGEKLKTPILDKFVSGWINIFSRSPKTKLAWKTQTGLPVPSYSTTRWWSKWEVIKHMHDAFGDVKSFLEDDNLSLNNQLINYAKACVKPAYDYFNRKFGEDLEVAVSAFKFARFFSPAKVVELLLTGNGLDKLRIFPFLNSDIIDQLKLELPKYLAAAEDISPTVDTLCGGRGRGMRMTSHIG